MASSSSNFDMFNFGNDTVNVQWAGYPTWNPQQQPNQYSMGPAPYPQPQYSGGSLGQKFGQNEVAPMPADDLLPFAPVPADQHLPLAAAPNGQFSPAQYSPSGLGMQQPANPTEMPFVPMDPWQLRKKNIADEQRHREALEIVYAKNKSVVRTHAAAQQHTISQTGGTEKFMERCRTNEAHAMSTVGLAPSPFAAGGIIAPVPQYFPVQAPFLGASAGPSVPRQKRKYERRTEEPVERKKAKVEPAVSPQTPVSAGSKSPLFLEEAETPLSKEIGAPLLVESKTPELEHSFGGEEEFCDFSAFFEREQAKTKKFFDLDSLPNHGETREKSTQLPWLEEEDVLAARHPWEEEKPGLANQQPTQEEDIGLETSSGSSSEGTDRIEDEDAGFAEILRSGIDDLDAAS